MHYGKSRTMSFFLSLLIALLFFAFAVITALYAGGSIPEVLNYNYDTQELFVLGSEYKIDLSILKNLGDTSQKIYGFNKAIIPESGLLLVETVNDVFSDTVTALYKNGRDAVLYAISANSASDKAGFANS